MVDIHTILRVTGADLVIIQASYAGIKLNCNNIQKKNGCSEQT